MRNTRMYILYEQNFFSVIDNGNNNTKYSNFLKNGINDYRMKYNLCKHNRLPLSTVGNYSFKKFNRKCHPFIYASLKLIMFFCLLR